MLKWYENIFFTTLWFCLERPVKNALFWLDAPVPECLRLVHGKELPVPRGSNSRLPTSEQQVTIAQHPAGSNTLHSTLVHSTLGTSRLPLPETSPVTSRSGQHPASAPWEPEVTIAQHFQCTNTLPNWWEPTWEPKVTMARNCRFSGVETCGSQPGNQRLPLQRIAGSQKLEFMFSKLSGYHCKELRVPKAWNSWFQTWKSIRY